MAAGQQAFTQQQSQQAVDAVLKAFNLPADWSSLVMSKIQELASQIQNTENRFNQGNIQTALNVTGQQITPVASTAPRINKATGGVIPGKSYGGGTLPDSQALSQMQGVSDTLAQQPYKGPFRRI